MFVYSYFEELDLFCVCRMLITDKNESYITFHDDSPVSGTDAVSFMEYGFDAINISNLKKVFEIKELKKLNIFMEYYDEDFVKNLMPDYYISKMTIIEKRCQV